MESGGDKLLLVLAFIHSAMKIKKKKKDFLILRDKVVIAE